MRLGLTLVELLIGLSITTVTAAIISVLVASTATGTNSIQDGRRMLVRLQATKAILADEIGNSRCILETGRNYIVYWAGDNPSGAVAPNNAVNLSELRLLEVSENHLVLYKVKWPTGYSNADILSADSTYAASSSWNSAVTTAKGLSCFTLSVVASNVSGMSSTLDASVTTEAKMITTSIVLNDGVTARTAVVCTALANPGAPW